MSMYILDMTVLIHNCWRIKPGCTMIFGRDTNLHDSRLSPVTELRMIYFFFKGRSVHSCFLQEQSVLAVVGPNGQTTWFSRIRSDSAWQCFHCIQSCLLEQSNPFIKHFILNMLLQQFLVGSKNTKPAFQLIFQTSLRT